MCYVCGKDGLRPGNTKLLGPLVRLHISWSDLHACVNDVRCRRLGAEHERKECAPFSDKTIVCRTCYSALMGQVHVVRRVPE